MQPEAANRTSGVSPELAEALASASRIVAKVIAGRSLADESGDFGAKGPARGAVLDLVYGSLRRYGRGDALLARLSTRKEIDVAVRALLLCALYALESGRYAEHTAVDQAVRAATTLGLEPAKGFVNAVLRGWTRRRAELEQAIEVDRTAKYMHPAWWIDRLRAEHPGQWEAMLAVGNERPPMGLRVNRRRITSQGYLERLSSEGMAARSAGPDALVLEQPVSVERLPGFAEGLVSIQDAGAQRAAPLLDLRDGQRVLDACAAPGGKSGHILECADVALTALDIGRERCGRIRENLARLSLRAQVLEADCVQLAQWWDGVPFERVLADVPCTGSGVVRRHPDIKWLRRSGDAGRFALTQARILEALWQVLAPGGKLLYVTCSVFEEENDAVVSTFLARHADALRPGIPGDMAAQLPPAPDHDGFFFALLEKQI